MDRTRIVHCAARFALAAGMATLGAGCSGGSSNGAQSSGTVHGRVTSNPNFAAGGAVSGAVVTALHLESDGSLTPLGGQAVTDANGSYDLTVSFDGTSVSDVIVKAEGSGNFSAEAALSAALSDGGSVTAPPMDGETTVEADVTIQMHVDHGWNSHDTIAGVESAIDGETAAAINAGSSYASDIAALSASVEAGLQARAYMMTTPSLPASEPNVQAFLQAEASAKADLDAALDAAQTQNEIDTAVATYQQAIFTAAQNATLTLGDYAECVKAELSAELSASAGLSASAQATLEVYLHETLAAAVTEADQAELTALNAGSTVLTDATNAQAQLETSLAASAGVAAQINGAWATYQSTIVADLKTTAEAASAGGSSAVDTVMSNLATAKTDLQAALTAAGSDAQQIAVAYSTYHASVQAAVEGNVTLGQLASAEVDACVEILIQNG